MPGLLDPEFDPGVIEGDGLPLDLPQPQAKQPGSKWKELAPLLALLPMALKQGGRVGGAALLRGFQQSQQQQAHQGRQDAQAASLDAYRQAQVSGQHDQRVAAAENNELQRRQQFLTQFGSGLEGLETPEAVQAYMALQGVQGDALGIPRAQLEAMAPAPTALQRKAATKLLDKLRQEHGTKFMEVGPQFTYSLPGDPQPVSFEEVLRRAGQAKDPNYVAPPPEADDLSKSGLDVQLAAAMARAAKGEPGAAEQVKLIESAIAKADSLRRDPADPTLRAIRELTLQQQRALQANGGLSPAQFSQAQALANDFQQETKEFRIQRSAYQRVVSSNPDSPAGHMALIFAYMKLLDPNSVVRETEYANAQNAAGVPDRVRNLYNAAIEGKILTPRQIQDFKAQARAIYQGSKSEALQTKAIYDQRATAQGLPPQSVTSMLEDPTEPAAPTTPPAAAPPRANPFRR